MYEEVFQSVKKWLYNVAEEYITDLKMEIEETQDSLLCSIDTARYVGELNVSRSDFCPYRYVEFYVLDVNKDSMQQPAFVFQDNENDTISDIIYNLDEGIKFIVSES